MKCSFCMNDIHFGKGIMYVKKEGKAIYFCSSKCKKNTLKLKRKPRETRWTIEFQKAKKQ